jgi:hypothetical protein
VPASLRRCLVTVLVALGVLLAGAWGAAAAADDGGGGAVGGAAVPGPVVVLGTAGLRWDDVSARTPALAALLANGSIAALVARSVPLSSCPVDGWLAASAGRRADAARAADGDCRPPAPADWRSYTGRAAAQGLGAAPGTLGDALTAAGRRSAAIGPGAAIALATGTGAVAHAWPADSDAALAEALATTPDVLVVDLGAVPDGPERGARVGSLDARLVTILNALPASATVLVVSLADGGSQPRMQVAAVVGPQPGGGMHPPALLRSGSARQDGLVLATDLPATVLSLLGLTVPDRVDGAPMRPVGRSGTEADRLQHVIDLDQAAVAVQGLVVPFMAVLVLVQAVLLAALAHLRLLRPLTAAAILGGALPAATVLAALVPWWRSDQAGTVLALVVLGGATLLAAVALGGPWRQAPFGPAGVIGGLTLAVLTADVATGSTLSLTTLMGGQPLIGGRFYGLGNPLFAVFGTAAVFAALALADPLLTRGRRPLAAFAVLGLGLFLSAIDVLPALGADVGGAPALLPAFGVLALRIAGLRPTWRRITGIASATVALIVLVAVADWLRAPAERTHLGRFVQTALDGGAWAVLRRKALQNLEILTSSPMTMALPVLAALLVWALARPRRFGLTGLEVAYRQLPLLRHGLAALGIMLAIAFAANDSGTSIPPSAALIALPLLVAVTARAVTGERGPGPTGPRPARR